VKKTARKAHPEEEGESDRVDGGVAKEGMHLSAGRLVSGRHKHAEERNDSGNLSSKL